MTDKNALKEKIKNLKNVNIIVMGDNYIYVTVSSPLFGFVDDLEFYFPQGETVAFYRSASRVGHSDMGQNRKRVDALIR